MYEYWLVHCGQVNIRVAVVGVSITMAEYVTCMLIIEQAELC